MSAGSQKKELTSVEKAARAMAPYLNRGGHGVRNEDIERALQEANLADTPQIRRAVMTRAQEMSWGQRIFFGG